MREDTPMKMLWTALALGLAFTVTAGCGDGDADKGKAGDGTAKTVTNIAFTAIPLENTTEMKARFDPLAAHLSKELGLEVVYVPSSNYDASVDMFVAGDIHLAWFGGLTGLQARNEVKGARAIAQGKVDPKYHSYFIAHVDTGIERSDEFPMELAGRTFTFGSTGSTSGRLMPEHFIRTFSKKSPKEFFGSEPNFSGGHDKTAKLVEAGSFECGALDYKTYDRMVAKGEIDPEVARIVWQTPDYPDYNWTVRPELGDELIAKLQTALVNLKDPAFLEAVNRSEGLIKASNADFEPLRALAEKLELLGRNR
jgi:phosphonate transport system substrate-binding protein